VADEFLSLSRNICYERDKDWQRDTQRRFVVMRFVWRASLD